MASGVAGATVADARAAHSEFLFPCVTPYYREPLVLVEASGVRVIDAEGREYLDLFAGILTTSIGHCHPAVVERVREQVGRLGHTSTLYVTAEQVGAARRLAELAPPGLKRTFFTNSGSEAVETAVMLACMYTGRSEVIALRRAYSGRTLLTSNITAHAAWRPLPSAVAAVKHALAPYPYHCPFKVPCDEECVEAYACDLVEVIETMTNGRPAALIVEPIQGVGGFVVPPPGYLKRAAEIIRSYGGLFISDEVQTGFGRTGRYWWGIQHDGVVPDIMVMAKGIANGFPVGATITTDEIAAAWKSKTISTFGGNPVSMAAVEATLDVMVREDVPTRSETVGARLRQRLEALAAEYEWIGEVRGRGLMLGLELVENAKSRAPSPRHAAAFLEASREEGVLVGLGGLYGNVVRIGPSMLITEAEVDEAADRLERACRRVAAQW